MARLCNDGRGRIGGRQKGTPNKPKALTGNWLANILGGRNQNKFEQALNGDWNETTPLIYSMLLLSYAIAQHSAKGEPLPAELATLITE